MTSDLDILLQAAHDPATLTRALLAAALAGVTASAFARQPPDLSGTWVAAKDAPAGIGLAPSAVFGERFAIRQEVGRITLLRPIRGRPTAMSAVHPLDGSEVRIMMPSRTCFGQPGQIVTTVWDAGALRFTIVGSIAPGGATSRIGLTYLFRKVDADTVVVETTMRDAAGGGPRPAGTVYRRSTDTLTPEPAAPAPAAPAAIAQLAWLAGDWVSDSGTATTEERWSPAAGGAMIATSRTVRGGVMTEFEFLCIAERNGTLVYTAMPNAASATDFTLTRIDADSATFENPAHDFPKAIRYARRADGGMEAVVSGAANSKPRSFVFKRKQ